MSRADGAPEASIEEILASIRKNFTDEPPAAGASSPAMAAGGDARTAGLPSFRSAADVTAHAPGTPLPTPPRSRAAAIDEDLDDLIDKKAAPLSVTQPAAPAAPPLSPVEAAREKWAHLLNPGTANGARSPDAPVLKIEPSAATATPASASSVPNPPVSTGLFAPRKGGFYPPSEPRTEPVLPLPPAPQEPAASTLVARALEQTAATSVRPGFIPSVAAPSPSPAPAAAPVAPSLAPEPPPAPPPVSVAAPLSRSDQPALDPGDAPMAAAELPAASARALDDLVAGLNSAAPPVVAPPAAAIRAQPVTPPAAPAASTAVDSPAVPSAPGRTLEDVVADMLRPLLEKWIDENMPRIVERALQRDAMLGRKTP